MKTMLRYFKNVVSPSGEFTHRELGSYEHDEVPWVPRKGEFVRFRDPQPPGKPHDHRETTGRVSDVITVVYGTCNVIEVYLES